MFRSLFALSLGIGGMFWIALAAQAQTTNCAERGQIVRQLQERFGEHRQGMGLQGGQSIVEVFVSADSRTWSILLTRPNGISCLVAAGQGWDSSTAENNSDPDA